MRMCLKKCCFGECSFWKRVVLKVCENAMEDVQVTWKSIDIDMQFLISSRTAKSAA
jgi:hypothetical protein